MDLKAKSFYVYELVRPDGRVFYVGKGSGRRINDHAREARKGHKCHKCGIIRKIWESGNNFVARVVFDSSDEQEAFAREKQLIAKYGRSNLANGTDGGEGGSGLIITDQFRKIHSQIAKARWSNPEYRKEMTEQSRRLARQPEWLGKVCGVLRARIYAIVRAREARWDDPAQHERLRQKNFERWSNPEEKEKLIERNKRADVRAQLSETRKRQWADPVYREKMLAARARQKSTGA